MSVQTANVGAATEAVRSHPIVRDARTINRTDATHCVLEIVLLPSVDRVPPEVLRALGENDCGIASVQRQGDHLVAEAI
ncbi:hypothetical protein [Natrarchaeobius oligotrophus]|uniref:Uncharacterized protein n=1 Tax=Natrarchaeobius chitinivorans TaxID=1679083 RepID=A0A3N6LU34_NATCH|nr:hypothetical protein [Natrarchaeobius chitinivorans]RQG93703.1 hypothetical protein EA472_22465 [Natrarchaeobius chitinivorans]